MGETLVSLFFLISNLYVVTCHILSCQLKEAYLAGCIYDLGNKTASIIFTNQWTVPKHVPSDFFEVTNDVLRKHSCVHESIESIETLCKKALEKEYKNAGIKVTSSFKCGVFYSFGSFTEKIPCECSTSSLSTRLTQQSFDALFGNAFTLDDPLTKLPHCPNRSKIRTNCELFCNATPILPIANAAKSETKSFWSLSWTNLLIIVGLGLLIFAVFWFFCLL